MGAWRRRYKLTGFLGLAFIGLTTVSLASFGLFSVRIVSRELRNNMERGSVLMCSALAHELGTYLGQHAAALSMASSLGDGKTGLSELPRFFPAFERIVGMDGQGKVTLPSGDRELGFDFSYRDFFIAAPQSPSYYVSASFMLEREYLPSAVLSVRMGKRVMAGYIRLDTLWAYVRGLPTGEGGRVAVIDRNGYYIAGADREAVSQRVSAGLESWYASRYRQGFTLSGSGGASELVSWAPVGMESGWTVEYRQSMQPAVRAGRLLFFMVFGIAFLYLCISALILASTLRLARKDLDRLISRAQAVAAGVYEDSAPFQGFAEFHELYRQYDIMARGLKDREAAIAENERRLLGVLDFLPVPVILLDENHDVRLMNRAFTACLGWTSQDIRSAGDWWPRLYPDESYRAEVQEYWAATLAAIADGKELPGFKGRLRCKDGGDRTMLGYAEIVNDRTIVVFLDITESDLAAERTKASLAEKEVLLKEIHHRVKNNLQMVISLLSLRSAGLEYGHEAFADSIDRIQVMATIHELLYQANDLAHIALDEYVRTIANWLSGTYAGEREPELVLELEPLPIDIDRAIPCGLILNELITNTMKYAFRDPADKPVLRVSARMDGKTLRLEVADNGPGLPEGVDPHTSESLGMQIVVSLCAQLGAEWSVDRSAGTSWRIAFTL